MKGADLFPDCAFVCRHVAVAVVAVVVVAVVAVVVAVVVVAVVAVVVAVLPTLHRDLKCVVVRKVLDRDETPRPRVRALAVDLDAVPVSEVAAAVKDPAGN